MLVKVGPEMYILFTLCCGQSSVDFTHSFHGNFNGIIVITGEATPKNLGECIP